MIWIHLNNNNDEVLTHEAEGEGAVLEGLLDPGGLHVGVVRLFPIPVPGFEHQEVP